ncbi:hypothetical protein M9H77_08068 [Catharanthus roseus]|uniref:Uncharacterized protein n=1 Tax=Catharanthus roseus TaxID=4058 RepID=A0ACC0BX23_CATRO|nr:hypothetical protein M9H77_08068 [Catharanthus roseus]
MFFSQISSERSGAQQATEVLGQEFFDQISPEGHMFMFDLFRLEPSVKFLFMLSYSSIDNGYFSTDSGPDYFISGQQLCDTPNPSTRLTVGSFSSFVNALGNFNFGHEIESFWHVSDQHFPLHLIHYFVFYADEDLLFVDLLESKSLSPNAGMKSDFILPTLAVSALLNIDENIPKQFKKFSKVKQQAHQAGSGTISMITLHNSSTFSFTSFYSSPKLELKRFSWVSESNCLGLSKVLVALKQVKAQGPDGLQACFLHKYWHSLGAMLTVAVVQEKYMKDDEDIGTNNHKDQNS